jgi:hypothetical protein
MPNVAGWLGFVMSIAAVKDNSKESINFLYTVEALPEGDI